MKNLYEIRFLSLNPFSFDSVPEEESILAIGNLGMIFAQFWVVEVLLKRSQLGNMLAEKNKLVNQYLYWGEMSCSLTKSNFRFMWNENIGIDQDFMEQSWKHGDLYQDFMEQLWKRGDL